MAVPNKTNALKCLKRALTGAPQVRGLRHGASDFQKWKTSTIQDLKRVFGNEDSRPREFERSLIRLLHEDAGANVDRGIAMLTSWVAEVREDWPATEGDAYSPNADLGISRRSNKVFVVHGHDEAARETVARFLERLKLKPIVLHEQSNQGRTIIEKFENHADVGFAVVLLTPDDEGASIEDKDNPKHRARQNVIFELGFFIGKLGRERVCALVKGDVETPSDYDGIVYTKLDGEDGWQMKLLRELRAAGFDIDANRAFPS